MHNLKRIAFSIMSQQIGLVILLIVPGVSATRPTVNSQTIQLPASAIRRFWLYHNSEPRGRRDWYVDGETWYEVEFRGQIRSFRTVGPFTVSDVAGTLVQLVDHSLQVFIPDAFASPSLMSRNDDTAPWESIGSINYVLGDAMGGPSSYDEANTFSFQIKEDPLFYVDSLKGEYAFAPKGRREWFKLPNAWLERNPDGVTRTYPISGQAYYNNNDVTTTLHMDHIPFAVEPPFSGVLVTVGTGNDGPAPQMFIPDGIGNSLLGSIFSKTGGKSIVYKSTGTLKKWVPIVDIERLGEAGVLTVDVVTNLEQVAQTALDKMPKHFDEHGSPDAHCLRWSFDMISSSKVLDGNQIVLTATYKGDIETHDDCVGCHLRWVYPVAILKFRPLVTQKNGQWVLTAGDVEFRIDFRADSDLSCSVANFPVGGILHTAMNNSAISQGVTNAITSVALPIPINQIWSQLSTPKKVPNTDSKYCFYPNPISFGTGSVTGPLNGAHIPIQLTTRSKIVVSETCAASTTSHPESASVTGSPVGFKMYAGIVVPYASIREQILGGLQKAPGLQVRDIHLDGGIAYLTLGLDLRTPYDDSFEFRIIPRFSASGAVISLVAAPTPETLSNRDEITREFLMSLADAITASCTLDVTSDLKKAQTAISGSQKLGDLKLDIGISNIKPTQIISSGQSLHVYAILEGKASGRI